MAKLVFLIAFLVIAGASARTLRVVDDTKECLRDVQEIAHQIPKVAKNLETMNIFGLMQDQFVVQESFKKAVSHCSSFEVTRFLNQTLVNGPAECFADILALVPKIQKFLADLASGNMTAIINDIQELIPLVQKTIQDCGAQGKTIANSKLTNFFNNFASEQCEAARQESVEAFANFMLSARSRNMSQAAQTFPVFIARVSAILHDCHLGQSAWNPSRYNFMEINHRNDNCSDDIAAIIKLVNQLIEHLQAGDIANVINDVIQLFPLLEKAADDCFQSVKQINPMDYVNMTTYNDWAKCIQGIVALVPHLQKLVQDITAGNISAVVEDINKLIPLVNQTISDCASAKTNLKPQFLINHFPSSACKNNWQMLVHNILNIQAARESHNMVKVFNMLPETVKLSTATINTCSKQRPLLIA